MKKLLLLPLAMLMCFGYTKDAKAEQIPASAVPQSSSVPVVRVTIRLQGWNNTGWDGGGCPVVHYMDENQNSRVIGLTDGYEGREIVTTSAHLFITGFIYNGTKPYRAIKAYTNSTQEFPEGFKIIYTGHMDEVPTDITIPVSESVSGPDDNCLVSIIVADSYDPINGDLL